MTLFWSIYISVLSLGTIAALTWLIFAVRKGQRPDTTEETVGHAFDGIEEFDNPLPKWWFMLFIGTIVFALGYLALYPGLGTWKGLLPGYNEAGDGKPFASGETIRKPMEQAPAEAPETVTLDGSPPNCSILSCTHLSASTWSIRP